MHCKMSSGSGPWTCWAYVLLSNIYAGAGKWDLSAAVQGKRNEWV